MENIESFQQVVEPIKQEEKKKSNKKTIIVVSILLFIALVSIIGASLASNRGVTYYHIGETGYNKDVSVRINSVKNVKKLGGEYLNDTTENNFILIECTVKNIGDSNVTIYSNSWDLYNSSNVLYERYYSLYINGITIYETLAPGLTKTFEVAFEVPTTTTQETYTAVFGHHSLNSNKIHFKLN